MTKKDKKSFIKKLIILNFLIKIGKLNLSKYNARKNSNIVLHYKKLLNIENKSKIFGLKIKINIKVLLQEIIMYLSFKMKAIFQ